MSDTGETGAHRTMFVLGTRPEAIKLAPVIQAARSDPRYTPIVVTTGQHREMLEQVMRLFGLSADEDLAIMKPGQDLFDVTAAVLTGMRDVLRNHSPEVVVVQGDTTSCFAGALAAFYEGVAVAHVEAGLRTYDLRAPFPEEANRQLTSRVATLHFPPTDRAREHLVAEGIEPERIHVTGNTVIDALLWVRERVQPQTTSRRDYVLITGHRRENFGTGFESLCSAIADLAERYPSWDFVYPVHLNPRVREPVQRILGDIDNVILTEPQGYAPFVALMDGARFILTDSGGVQEEAPSLGKPVLVMREKTERPEAVDAGTVRLVGTDRGRIVEEATRLIEDAGHYRAMAAAHNPYGDGRAGARILSAIAEHLGASQ